MEQKKSDFIVILLSSSLIISCLVAGFFAWKTQNLVKGIQGIRSDKLGMQTPIPTATPKPVDPVIINNLKDNDLVTSPIKIEGTIDKKWTFESTFAIEILDNTRKSLKKLAVDVNFKNEESQIGSFSISIPFTTKADNGFIVIHADNPSGLPQNDKSIEIPVKFETNSPVACTMEAKICPDGSAVGRSGPKCEFAPCPVTSPQP